MKRRPIALWQSLICLLLCVSMLAGTTFAWFTDRVTTGVNTIAAGNLDVELYHSNAAVQNEQVKTDTILFKDLNGNPILWEPGVVSYENLRVTNEGDLALQYRLAMETANENFVVYPDGTLCGLSQILKVGVVEGGITATDRADVVAAVDAANWTSLANFLRTGNLLPAGKGESEKTWGVVVYWQPGDNDNLWNLNNGKQLDTGSVLSIDLGVKLVATQLTDESDSFGPDYDQNATFPGVTGGSVSTQVPVENNIVTADTTLQGNGFKAFVPAGTKLADGATQLTFSVFEKDSSEANLTLDDQEEMYPLDVHIEGTAPDNDKPILVTIEKAMTIGLNIGNYKLYHVENGVANQMTAVAPAELDAHNEFTYDPATGDITLAMQTFSEVAMVAEEAKWKGGVDHSWYVGKSSPYQIANADQLWSFSQIVGGMNGQTRDSFAGKTVKLIANIDLNDGEGEGINDPNRIFYPIGYYSDDGKYEKTGVKIDSTLKTFEGTFDGQGHTVSNFYHNTWEMKGDHNWYSPEAQYYRDGMGLFGRVYKGTVKNLTVRNFKSDGEIATTGVIAAYADGATFENIAIFDCNPRVYNIGNGGIVGCVGWYAKEANLKTTFNNITVDNSNKISALWGSYDVPCGGIVGQYYCTSGQTSANKPANGGIHLKNCHVSAQMDVYNDVCGNYQYYAYRYAGMLIGSISENETIGGHVYPKMDKITASGCTVHYESWNDYYYCEFEKNGHPSYSGPDDYKFSRVPHSEINFTDSNGNGIIDTKAEIDSVIGCKHKHTAAEDNQAVYLPFSQLFTGYGWGVTSKGLADYQGVTTMDITHTDDIELVEKFKKNDALTGNFLYRVGNKNAFPIGKLFQEISDDIAVDSGVYVSVTSLVDGVNLVGTFTKNEKDWTQSTLHITGGTGPAKLTIQDYNKCKPFELFVEVVDGNNIVATSAQNNTLTGWTSNGSNVLLENVSISSGGSLILNGGILFGNGFELDATNAAYVGVDMDYKSYVISVTDADIDNIKIIGAKYPSVGYTKDQDYYRPLLFMTSGDCRITNSYLSGTASPIRSGCNLELVNTTLDGGVYANLDMRSGTLILDNVTTINKGSSTEPFGLGIVVYQEGGSDNMSITIKNALKQYNLISKAQTTQLSSYAKMVTDEMFKTTFAKFQYTDSSGDVWVNAGIISMNDLFDGKTNIVEQRADGHGYSGLGKTISLGGKTRDCYVYTVTPTANDLPATPSAGIADQHIIKPVLKFKHELNNLLATPEQPNDYCIADGGVVAISMDHGDAAFGWKPAILEAKKNGLLLAYTAEVTVDGNRYVFTVTADGTVTATKNGANYTAQTIPFGTEGTYSVVYTYKDPYNFKINDSGEIVSFEHTYTEMLSINVVVAKPKAQHAVFTFGKDGTAYKSRTESITMADGTVRVYVMPDVDAADDGKIGATTVNGKTVYYPITKMYTSDGVTAHKKTWYACFPIFKDAVQIVDYADGGTGTEIVYNQNKVTTTDQIPATLEATSPQTAFLYAMNKTDYPAPTTPTAVSGAVCYTCNRNGLDSGAKYPRAATTYTAEYKYVDNLNTAYYYYVGYACEEQTWDGGCVTPETLVTLADGTQKRIDQVTYNDNLLVWNFFKSEYAVVPSALIVNHGYGDQTIIKLTFEDGTVVKAITAHSFFDANTNKWELINAENAVSYIGHAFVQATADSYKTVKLTDVEVYQEYTESYSLVSACHYNFITENMFSLTNSVHDMLAGLVVGENMTYDYKVLESDMRTYGRYTYDDFADYISYRQYVAFNGDYLKISVEKGYITFDAILALIEAYL